MKHVVLCNEQGKGIGTEEIMRAHEGEGMLHLAFSVFVFRNDGTELLVQQRSGAKPLFPLFWANTCCSHPQEGEDIIEAAERRLQEEMGFTCPLQRVDSFVYQAADPTGGGTEHEFDTVLLGHVDNDISIQPDSNEVADYKWLSLEELQEELDTNPEVYAPWFPEGLSLVFGG